MKDLKGQKMSRVMHSSIILVLYYLLMCFRASLSHVYRAARSSKRAGSIFSSVYIGTAARLTPFLVSSVFNCF